ncbi:ubiquinol-cytochrome-c reductase complex assembly factor 1-like [Penaeus japonicus]|uniref:ubiquinol-cytochrome-c reductase complex assembly factor 1-like n=1 Tax=Penaeus japonicus TaxID=27405 RepID=UPI001C70F1C2|nr:ubiquinol-cytochrome-c reductase complex assembly factor 1-like [Penaeus japonicus]
MLRNSLPRLLQSTRLTEPARNVTVLASLSSQKFGTCIQVSPNNAITNSSWSTAYLPNSLATHTSKRYSGTDASLFKRFIKKTGLLKYSRTKLKRSGFLLYSDLTEKVRVDDFFEVCDLPDTFFSWFLVTELHIWMLMVRLMAEGKEGRFTRNALIEALWEDADARSKKLGAASLSIRKEQMEAINSSFQAALFGYDEALIEDDRVLAGALWRRLFSKKCEDPERLECCVQYVRKQAYTL